MVLQQQMRLQWCCRAFTWLLPILKMIINIFPTRPIGFAFFFLAHHLYLFVQGIYIFKLLLRSQQCKHTFRQASISLPSDIWCSKTGVEHEPR